MKHPPRVIPRNAREKIVQRHEKGFKQVALYYVNRKLIGHRSWDNEGHLAQEYAIRNNEKHGVFVSYWPNGIVSWVTHYVDGKEHGVSRQFDWKGELIGTYRMRHGTGVDLWFTAPGELSEERYVRDGKWDGFERWWITRHSVSAETHFKENLEHGIKREWTARGNLRRGYPRYFIRGNRVPKREYERACREDSSLPPYRKADDSPKRVQPKFSSPARKSSWRYFGVHVHGRNFQLAWQDERGRDQTRRVGFYTTVHVKARNAQQAELRAVKILKGDKALLASVRNLRSDPPRMLVDDIVELESFEGLRVPRTGFAFYDERGPRLKRKSV